MAEKLLVTEQIDAGAEFVRDFNDYIPVSVALWVVPADSGHAFLYLASDDIDDNNFDVAYGEVLRKLSGKRSQWLDPFQVKLVNSSDPIAQDAMKIRERYRAPLITRYGGSSLGGTSIDDVCIYPPISAMKATP
jgi:hypothetical protein